MTGEVIRWVAIAQIPLLFNTPLTRANAAIGRPARAAIWNVVFLPFLVAGVIYYAPRGVVEVAQFIMVLRLISYPLFLWANLKGAGMSASGYIKSTFALILCLVVFCIVGLFLREYIAPYSVVGQVAFLAVLLVSVVVAQYIFYRNHSIGKQVLRWVVSRIETFVKIPKLFVI